MHPVELIRYKSLTCEIKMDIAKVRIGKLVIHIPTNKSIRTRVFRIKEISSSKRDSVILTPLKELDITQQISAMYGWVDFDPNNFHEFTKSNIDKYLK